MGIDQKTLQTMNTLANGFANERVEGELDKLEKMMSTDGSVAYSREKIRKEIGRLLAVGYSKGYADCYEGQNVKRLIF